MLFRHRDVFVGEAVSVRLITPPLHDSELEQVPGVSKSLQGANSYTSIEDAAVYDRLREVIDRPGRQARS